MKWIRGILIVLLAVFAFYIYTFRQNTDELLAKEEQLRAENEALAQSLNKAEEEAGKRQTELAERTEAVQPYIEEYEVWKKRTDELLGMLQH